MHSDINAHIENFWEENIVFVSGLHITRKNQLGKTESYLVEHPTKVIGTGLQPPGGKLSQENWIYTEAPVPALQREIIEEIWIDIQNIWKGKLDYKESHVSALPGRKKLIILRFGIENISYKDSLLLEKSIQTGSDVATWKFVENPFDETFPAMTPQTYWLARKQWNISHLQSLFESSSIKDIPDLQIRCEVEYWFYKLYFECISTIIKDLLQISPSDVKHPENWVFPDDTESKIKSMKLSPVKWELELGYVWRLEREMSREYSKYARNTVKIDEDLLRKFVLERIKHLRQITELYKKKRD